MKKQLQNKLPVFTIIIVLFSVLPEFIIAQVAASNLSPTGYLCRCGYRNYGCTTNYHTAKDIRRCEATCAPLCGFAAVNILGGTNLNINTTCSTTIQQLAWKELDEKKMALIQIHLNQKKNYYRDK